VARAKKGKGQARRKVKKAESSDGDSGLPRRFTQREKGKSKGEFSLS
jgi:hypothetical protein